MVHPDVRRRLYAVILIGLVGATSIDARAAEAWAWKVVNARGTALVLVGQQWQVIYPGDPVSDGEPFRTLRSGRLQLSNGPESIEFSGNTAAQLNDDKGNVVITQYLGELTINSVPGSDQITVEVSTLSIGVAAGAFSTVVAEGRAEVQVREGTASIVDRATGHQVTLGAGQSVTSLSGGDLRVTGNGELPKMTDASGTTPSTTAGTGSGEGKGNSGSNGNTGNASSNSGGNSNGNASGNGNGSAGSNGNSSNSGNGNSGGKS